MLALPSQRSEARMSDIAKWLRTYLTDEKYNGPSIATDDLMNLGADEIERLRAELDAAKWWADKHDICWNDLIGGGDE